MCIMFYNNVSKKKKKKQRENILPQAKPFITSLCSSSRFSANQLKKQRVKIQDKTINTKFSLLCHDDPR